MPFVELVMPLFRLNSQIDRSGTKYVLIEYSGSTLVLDEVGKEMG